MKAKLEAELKSIQLQHEDRFKAQSKDINDLQESILLMASDVDEIRRRLEQFAMNRN